MKRKHSSIDEEESRLSQLLFNTSKGFAEKLKPNDTNSYDLGNDHKPVWVDDDDENFELTGKKTSNTLTDKLKNKFEALIGTPGWASLNKTLKAEDGNDDNNELLRTVGHLHQKKSTHLPKDFLEIKQLPKINSGSNNEGTIITCVEFHPKISVSLVAGQSGVVSLVSIGGGENNKLHSFKLKKWKVHSAHFTPDGAEAFISSKYQRSYCVYNLIKAEPTLVQLPHIVKKPIIFQMSHDGKYLATSDGFDEVYLISTASKELIRALKHNTNVQSVCFSFTCDKLYCYGAQGEVTIWDLTAYRVVQKFYDHGCVTASCITTSQCGRLLATGSGEGIVNIYNTDNFNNSNPLPLKVISNLNTKITKLKFNASSEILATSSSFYPNAIKLVHIPSYHVFANFPNQSVNMHQIDTVSFSPNSGYMAVGNNKGSALLFRLKYYKNY